MKKKKQRKVTKRMSKPRPNTPQLSNHPIASQANRLRDIVHGALADAGINNLSLRSMQFAASASPSDPCPPNQHRQLVCTSGPGGVQSCDWECVDI
jgi:hypothetical protein